MMVKIEHIALWASDIENLRSFYMKFFGAVSNEKYHNPAKGLQTYFLIFPEGGPRLEIMQRPDVNVPQPDERSLRMGYAHMAFSLSSRKEVDNMTDKLARAGFKRLDGPRTTGDGYYESTFLDPEGNLLELTE